jgi:O-antigen/teichoic acid export membrane protein
MSKIKRLAGETVLYGLGSIVPKFLNFLLVRLHTAAFLPDEYGVITKLFAYVAVINIIFTFGMETGILPVLPQNRVPMKEGYSILLKRSFYLSVLFFRLSLLTLAQPIANALEIPGKSDLVIWLVAIMFWTRWWRFRLPGCASEESPTICSWQARQHRGAHRPQYLLPKGRLRSDCGY